MLNFQNLNLNPTILEALEKKGYTTPTPIQAQSIPHLLEGRDLLGIAQTGTGKTAAFSLPILHKLASGERDPRSNQIRALILAPTRELAIQIGENIELYGKGLKLKHAVIFGGVNEFHQINALKNGLDIVVATLGRLLDLTNQGYVRFSQIEVFVLDEADRMLDMGFINDVKKIIAKLPQKRQSLLFSATMPAAVSSLVNSILKNPVKVEITPQSTTVERINQKVYHVDKSHKPALLLDVVIQPDVATVLVFCKTKHGTNKVATYLEKHGVAVAAIHGNKSQAARERALKDLRQGKVKVLIATDIAARGIDVSSISHVVNYDIPLDPESYVHRIGRTARAGREGIAISFCDMGENLLLRAIEKIIGMKIPVDNSHAFHGKEAVHDASQGRMLSRNKPKPKSPSDENFKKREGGRPLERSRDNNSRSQVRERSSGNRYERSSEERSTKSRQFSDKERHYKNASSSQSNERSGSEKPKGESMAKKIFRKFGFGKKAESEESRDYKRGRSKNGGRNFYRNKNK